VNSVSGYQKPERQKTKDVVVMSARVYAEASPPKIGIKPTCKVRSASSL